MIDEKTAVVETVIFVIWFVVVTILMLKYHRRNVIRSSYFEQYKQRRDQLIQNREQLEAQHRQMQKELESLRRRVNDPAQCIIPPKYHAVAEILWSYIKNGRADNLKEAMDRYDEEQRNQWRDNVLRQAAQDAAIARQNAEQANANSQEAAEWAKDTYWDNRWR